MTMPHPFNSIAALARAGGYLATVYIVAGAMWCVARARLACRRVAP